MSRSCATFRGNTPQSSVTCRRVSWLREKAIIGVLDDAKELLAFLHLLEAMFGHAERQVDDLAAPDVDRPAQSADDDAHVAGALRAKNVGREEAGARGQGEQDVGDGGAVRAALPAFVGQRRRLIFAKDAELIDTSLLTVDQVVDEILARLKRKGFAIS